jgi:exodeoxyribonuclease VII small subunit
MAKKVIDTFDYPAKSQELSEVLERLQSPDIELDEASKLYEQGMVLVAELEDYLKHAEQIVRQHKAAV